MAAERRTTTMGWTRFPSGREHQNVQAKASFLHSTQLCGNLWLSVAVFLPVWHPAAQPGMCCHGVKDYDFTLPQAKRHTHAKATGHYLFIAEGHRWPERRCWAEATQGPGFEDLGWFQWATELSSRAKSLRKKNQQQQFTEFLAFNLSDHLRAPLGDN